MLGAVPFALRGTTPVIVTWGGGFPDDNFSTASNWYVAPPANDGSEILDFSDNSNSDLRLDIPASFLGIQVEDDWSGITIRGRNSLTIGSGGIAMESYYGSLTINRHVNVILSAPQTWNASAEDGYDNSITVNGQISETGGHQSLLLTSANYSYGLFTFNSGASNFSGGVTVQGAGTALVLGASSTGISTVTSGPVGTGTLTLGDGTQLTTNTSSPIKIGNTVTIGDGSGNGPVTLGGPPYQSDDPTTNLTLAGPVMLGDSGTQEIDIGTNSTATFSGGISGSGVSLTLNLANGAGYNANSLAIFTGPVNLSALNVDDYTSVIFDGGPSQLTLGSHTGGGNYSYIGLGSSYAGYVADFITLYINQPQFKGTLGLDTVSGSAATFPDAIDMTTFGNESESWVGLGSATSAILTGTLTPPLGLARYGGTTYPFGGGGGTLTITSSLVDSSYDSVPQPNKIDLEPGNAPLTLILQGSLSYSGTTTVVGGALIFDTPVSPNVSGQSFYAGNGTQWGYIGYTENATVSGDGPPTTMTPSFFLGYFDPTYGSIVVGFDSRNPASPRTISGTIDLTLFSSNTFIGTATAVNLAGTIIPAAGGPYQFTGVKGGQLTVSSTLEGTTGVVIGLPSPMESFGSQSSVTLSGDNAAERGATALMSGYLYVTNGNSLGTGQLVVPNRVSEGSSGWVATLAVSPTAGTPVVLPNPIKIPINGLALNTGSSNQLTLNGVISNYSSNGTLGIFGPVDLEGNNTYSGGTTVNVSPTTVIQIGTGSNLGTGTVTVNGGTLNFMSLSPNLAPSWGGVNLTNTTLNFLGSAGGIPVLNNLQMAESTLNFAGGTAPVINNLESDTLHSGNAINLGSDTGAALTINLGEDPEFHGTIAGPGSLEISGGGGNTGLDLAGANTYSGGTKIDAGAILAASSNSALGTGPVTVNGVLATNLGITLTNPITVNGDGVLGDGVLAGFGTYSPSPGGNITFANNASIVPGIAVLGDLAASTQVPAIATLTFGGAETTVTFGPGGNLAFSLMDANGLAGVGYSTVSLTGGAALSITATPSTQFNIYLFSFAPGSNQYDTMALFNSTQMYQWTLVSSTVPITGFNADAFNFNLDNFSNSLGAGHFFVSESGDNLMLNFTPVPEPSTWVLMLSGLGVLAFAFRRRRATSLKKA